VRSILAANTSAVSCGRAGTEAAPRIAHSAPVRLVAAGNALLAPGVTRRLIAEFARIGAPRSPSRTQIEGLTERESEVLALVARGMSNGEIARHLVVAEQTIKTHVSRILMKLGLRDRTQMVVLAYESGLVHPGG